MMIKKIPSDKTVWIQRGLVYADLGNHVFATADFSQAIKLDPECLMAVFHMATSELKAGHIPSAIEEFKKCEMGGETAQIHDGFGCCYHAVKDYSQAIVAFGKAIEGEPYNIQFFRNRAQCYFDMGMYEICIQDLQSAL